MTKLKTLNGIMMEYSINQDVKDDYDRMYGDLHESAKEWIKELDKKDYTSDDYPINEWTYLRRRGAIDWIEMFFNLEEQDNYQEMEDTELVDLFKNKWNLANLTLKEGKVLWTIFSNNNRYLYKPSNKIIGTGSFRWFGCFISKYLIDKKYPSDYLDFYCSCVPSNDSDYIRIWNIVEKDVIYLPDHFKEDK